MMLHPMVTWPCLICRVWDPHLGTAPLSLGGHSCRWIPSKATGLSNWWSGLEKNDIETYRYCWYNIDIQINNIKFWRIPDQQYQHDRSISQHSWCPSISVHKPRWPASDFDPGSSLGLIDQLRPLLCSLGAAAQHFKSDLRTILRELLLHTETKVRKGWKGLCRFLCHPSLPQKFLTQSILTPSKPQAQSMTVIPISYPKGSAKLASPMDRTVCVLNVKASVEPLQRIGEIIHIETRHAFIDKVSIME